MSGTRFSGTVPRHEDENSPAASSGVLVETVEEDDGRLEEADGSDLDSLLASVADRVEEPETEPDTEPEETGGVSEEPDTRSEATTASEGTYGRAGRERVSYEDLGDFVNLCGNDVCRGIFSRRHNRETVLAVCGALQGDCRKAGHEREDSGTRWLLSSLPATRNPSRGRW